MNDFKTVLKEVARFLEYVAAVIAAILGVEAFSSCATTRAIITNKADGTHTSVSITGGSTNSTTPSVNMQINLPLNDTLIPDCYDHKS